MNKKVLIVVLCFILAIVSLYSFFITNTPTLSIQVGIPNLNSEGKLSSIDFDAPVTNKQDTDIILLAMINARKIDDPFTDERFPNAIIMLRYRETGFPYQVWFLEDSVILGTDPNNEVEYRIIHNDHTNVVPLLKELVNNIHY